MKAISVRLHYSLLADFKQHARRTNSTVAELIREAMCNYRDQQIVSRQSLTGLKPLDLGKVLRPFSK